MHNFTSIAYRRPETPESKSSNRVRVRAAQRGTTKKYLLAVRGTVRIWLAAGTAVFVVTRTGSWQRARTREGARNANAQVNDSCPSALCVQSSIRSAHRGLVAAFGERAFVRSHGTRREPALKARACRNASAWPENARRGFDRGVYSIADRRHA